jgi:hypothetical protein
METLTERVRVPLLPLTNTQNTPAGAMQERVESTEVMGPKMIVLGLREQERLALEVEFVRLIVPLKPFNALTVMVEIAGEPGVANTAVGFAETLKSGIKTKRSVTLALCVRALLLPLIVAR